MEANANKTPDAVVGDTRAACLSPGDFIHPEDRNAREQLEAIPGFASALRAFMRALPEQLLHGLNMAQKIRLGPRQLPGIYRHLPPLSRRLGIAEPEFYLEMNPLPNAYTYGDTRVFVTVTSGLLECLDEDEVHAVIAHECGHIACRHVLYHTMATLILQHGGNIFGPLAALAAPLRLALLYWQRRSEFSADRAAAVALGDARPVVETMIRLAGGPRSLTASVDIDEYLDQARAYDALQDSSWDKMLQGLAIMNSSHPFSSVRAREIVFWSRGEHGRRVMTAANNIPPLAACPGCGRGIEDGWKHCAGCGQALPELTENK